MRVTSKGQVTIPKHIRHRHGIAAGTEVEFVERGGDVVVQRGGKARRTQPRDDFADHLERMTGIVDLGMSTDDFMRLMRGDD